MGRSGYGLGALNWITDLSYRDARERSERRLIPPGEIAGLSDAIRSLGWLPSPCCRKVSDMSAVKNLVIVAYMVSVMTAVAVSVAAAAYYSMVVAYCYNY